MDPTVFEEKIRQIEKQRPDMKAADTLGRIEYILAQLTEQATLLRQKVDRGIDVTDVPDTVTPIIESLEKLETAVTSVKDPTSNAELAKQLKTLGRDIVTQIKAIKIAVPAVRAELKPNISVQPTPVTVRDADLRPLEKALQKLEAAVEASATTIVSNFPEPDNTELLKNMQKLQRVMEEIRDRPIPVPEFPAEFRTHLYGWTGSAWLPVLVDDTGQLLGVGGGGGGGAVDAATFDFMDDTDYLFMDGEGFDFMDA